MKVWRYARFILPSVLFLMISGSNPALTTQLSVDERENTSTSSVASARWFNTEVQTTHDIGQYPSFIYRKITPYQF